MTGRYSVPKPITSRASIACEGGVGDGHILDLSMPSCLLETGLLLQVGQMLQLRLTFAKGPSLHITLAAVRWVNGWRAGLAFIRMSDQNQARLLVGFTSSRRPSSRTWTEKGDVDGNLECVTRGTHDSY